MGTEGMAAIELRPVCVEDSAFLYRLLRERPKEINISHKQMPPYDDHVGFVQTWPAQYEAWYTVWVLGRQIGSVYLTHRQEVGIFLLKEFQGKRLGALVLAALLKSHPKKRYLANIAPSNPVSAGFFSKMGFKPIQHTYELEMK